MTSTQGESVMRGDLDLIAESILDSLAEILKFLSPIITSLLLVLRLIEFKALLAHADERIATDRR